MSADDYIDENIDEIPLYPSAFDEEIDEETNEDDDEDIDESLSHVLDFIAYIQSEKINLHLRN